jgi:hypothetical protein
MNVWGGHLADSGWVVALYCFSVWTSEGMYPAECGEKPVNNLLNYLNISSVDKFCEKISSLINLDTTFPSILLLLE